MELYNREKPKHRKLSKAYEAAEDKWIEERGKRCYKNYASFRSSKSHYVRCSGKLV